MYRDRLAEGNDSKLGARRQMWSLVVEACLQDDEIVAVDEVDEAVFLGDAPRPGSCE
jgi:hypothetical protein